MAVIFLTQKLYWMVAIRARCWFSYYSLHTSLTYFSLWIVNEAFLHTTPKFIPFTSLEQDDLIRVFKWCAKRLWPLNIKKCVVLPIGRRNRKRDYFISNTLLNCIRSHTNLGVTIETLSWSQIQLICKRANSLIGTYKCTFGTLYIIHCLHMTAAGVCQCCVFLSVVSRYKIARANSANDKAILQRVPWT